MGRTIGAQIWEVVGASEKGGITVRVGWDLGSREEPEPLAQGALIRGMELQGDRLRFELLAGTGPAKGWVTIRTRFGKNVVPTTTRVGLQKDEYDPPVEEVQAAEAPVEVPKTATIQEPAEAPSKPSSSDAGFNIMHLLRHVQGHELLEIGLDDDRPLMESHTSTVPWRDGKYCDGSIYVKSQDEE
eukprot:gnl/TRDRNA2_/TRDRNA2_194717_c0_seq1.p1 gnl/TRDRNA2_/TRDRNA2_194717_c0~~gnl/TRDRNA2_/TRDRNA2_194717_c0_seq1.p1  ORF type:complete len:186 (+),score=40.76 gnl/TRDRNA2_/TRDRNA2_194717_c0_seq1:92-649(+)